MLRMMLSRVRRTCSSCALRDMTALWTHRGNMLEQELALAISGLHRAPPGGDTVRLPHKNDDLVDNEHLGDFTRALPEHAYCTCESYSSKHTFSTRCFLLSWRLQERMCKARGKLAVSQGGDVQRMVEDILTMAMSHYWVKLQTPKMRLLSSGVGEGSSHRER
jgi:hypothetical protein